MEVISEMEKRGIEVKREVRYFPADPATRTPACSVTIIRNKNPDPQARQKGIDDLTEMLIGFGLADYIGEETHSRKT